MISQQTSAAIESFLNSDLGQATIRKGHTDAVCQHLELFIRGIDQRRWRLEPATYATRTMTTCLRHLSQTGDLQGLRIRNARDDPDLWAAVRGIVETEITARGAMNAGA